MKRIGILTSGGDCQGLNSTIRAGAKTLYQNYGNDAQPFALHFLFKILIHTYFTLTLCTVL